ncbi:E2 ubiquitin-conjugating enzyme [Malassezia sp. CBS 17886]|nr:E2 ubiquitin-conjugating enzyme [Malassezia sp. CBS 17886]
MSNARLKRVAKEIAVCANDNDDDIQVHMVDDSPFHLLGTFPGPENSPFEEGLFRVDICVPEGYPFQPLKMRFLTKVYHPNVSSQSGAICLDILKDQWSPVYTLKSTLLSLRSLLCSPEPSDPQDAEVAKHYTSDVASYEQTARHWTHLYASRAEQIPELDPVRLAGLRAEHVGKFTDMGFEQARVVDVLKRLNYRGDNVQNVPDSLVTSELLRP